MLSIYADRAMTKCKLHILLLISNLLANLSSAKSLKSNNKSLSKYDFADLVDIKSMLQQQRIAGEKAVRQSIDGKGYL